MVAPIRMFERHAVSLDTRLVQELIEAESFSFYDIATLAKRVELFDETVDVAVPLQQAPVEPTDVAVLAALLLPPCVRRTSSPIRSIGVPAANNSSARKFLTWRLRSTSIVESSVGPSAPQFQLRF